MTEIPAENQSPAENELLDEIERRQDEVLSQLDTLNMQLEQVLKLHSAPEDAAVSDETNGENRGAEQLITEQSSITKPAGGAITKDVEEETTAQEIPTATPAIEPLIAAPLEHAGPLMIVPVPENSGTENGAAPSEC